MKYFIAKDDTRPAYLQLYSQIKDDIVSGAYAYGAKLPSKRILAEETGASVITAEHAYGLLCDEGYAESKERSGYFVIYRQSDFTMRGSDTAAPFFSMREDLSGDSPFPFPFTVIAKTMRKVLSDSGELILKKSPNKGCLQLRLALSAYLKRNTDICADPETIIVGSGAEYLYWLVVTL